MRPEDCPPETVEPAAPTGKRSRVRRVGRLLWENAWLGLALGGVLVATRFVDFEPPQQVRTGKGSVADLVGDAPPQEFSHELSNPQAVQVRATLRIYGDNELQVAAPDPETDAQGKLLSQPVITTLLGMNATVDQTVRLDDGALQVELELYATPREAPRAKGAKGPPPLTLEHELIVRSRKDDWWGRHPVQRVHLDTRGMLLGVDDNGHRVVFSVDEHLFSLDIEVRRAFGGGTSLAATQ